MINIDKLKRLAKKIEDSEGDFYFVFNDMLVEYSQEVKDKSIQSDFKKVKKILRKDLPNDFKDFYSKFSELDSVVKREELYNPLKEYKSGDNVDLPYQKINDIYSLFDHFKPNHPSLKMGEDINDKIAKKYAFHQRYWLEAFTDKQEEYDEFNKILRLKELMGFNGASMGIMVDFYDKNEPYALYLYENNGYGSLHKLEIDLQQFIENFIYFQLKNEWVYFYIAYKNKERLVRLYKEFYDFYKNMEEYKEKLMELKGIIDKLE